ncbi:MAG TPA: 3-hydroxyacyl-CoA dehydrogenase NAD-binding domain-containing protein [Candidatus Acidoferrum sp.]|nr:3-hydroxyacyl-CoA dehydrogenase NAD-binding domain-containing protein [Candidatus Acidoferrum sp.]
METKVIAIVGAADLGRRIAYAAVLAGYHTILENVSPSTLEQGMAWITQELGDEVSCGKIAAAVRDDALANLSAAHSAEDASREADLIIETVSDEMEMKIELFTIFDKFAKPGAIFATTTASLSVTEMADVTFCPERCVGMRFVADARKAERLELVKGRETSGETIAACRELGRCMGLEISVLSEEQVLSATELENGSSRISRNA